MATKDRPDRSKESMRNSIVAKLIMVAKQRPEASRPKVLSSKAITELVDLVESRVEGWMKRTSHLEKARTYQSALQQARNNDIDVSCLTVEEKDKNNNDKRSKNKEEKKEKKDEWEDLKIVDNQLKSEQVKFKDVNSSSTGVVLTSWRSLRDNYHKFSSSQPLVFIVPGHFNKSEEDTEIDKMKWKHEEIILSGKVGSPMSKKVTFFDITGFGLPERIGGEVDKSEDGVKGDALREVLLRAVFKFMTPQDSKEVEKDIGAYMKTKVLHKLQYDSLQVFGVVKKKEYVEEIVKMKTEDANALIMTQLQYNRMGLFFREVIRPGSNVSSVVKEESMIFGDKHNKGLTELSTICAEVGDAFIVVRPGEMMALGIRVKKWENCSGPC